MGRACWGEKEEFPGDCSAVHLNSFLCVRARHRVYQTRCQNEVCFGNTVSVGRVLCNGIKVFNFSFFGILLLPHALYYFIFS